MSNANVTSLSREQVLAAMAEHGITPAKEKTTGGIKISAKGALSVYGLGRFPVTLYASQWENLLAKSPEILAFITANKAQLKTKGEA